MNENTSTSRILSIDALRGLSVFGMILSATIGYMSDLPAWMFHCQVPPPDYVFDPSVRGISWVDMVFPFFLFSMGAAIPFSLGKRIRSGEKTLNILLTILRRSVLLLAFSVVIGNSQYIGRSGVSQLWCGLWALGLWLMLFASFIRTRSKWINIAGWAGVIGFLLLEQFVFRVPLEFAHNDCILLLLAEGCAMAGIIWYFTRSNVRLRALAWLLVIALKALGFGFTQYLVILLPATVVGDMIGGGKLEKGGGGAVSSSIALIAVLLQLWGLFTRQVALDFCITFALGAAFVLLTFRRRTQLFSRLGWIGFALLLVGIAVDPLDGGIAEDYCNLSYLFVTCGQAVLTLCFLLWVEGKGALSRNLVLTGQNPMIAYTVDAPVVSPLLYLVGFLGWYDDICAGSPLLGIGRGLIVTLCVMAVTCFFSYRKIFWRS